MHESLATQSEVDRIGSLRAEAIVADLETTDGEVRAIGVEFGSLRMALRVRELQGPRERVVEGPEQTARQREGRAAVVAQRGLGVDLLAFQSAAEVDGQPIKLLSLEQEQR